MKGELRIVTKTFGIWNWGLDLTYNIEPGETILYLGDRREPGYAAEDSAVFHRGAIVYASKGIPVERSWAP